MTDEEWEKWEREQAEFDKELESLFTVVGLYFIAALIFLAPLLMLLNGCSSLEPSPEFKEVEEKEKALKAGSSCKLARGYDVAVSCAATYQCTICERLGEGVHCFTFNPEDCK